MSSTTAEEALKNYLLLLYSMHAQTESSAASYHHKDDAMVNPKKNEMLRGFGKSQQ